MEINRPAYVFEEFIFEDGQMYESSYVLAYVKRLHGPAFIVDSYVSPARHRCETLLLRELSHLSGEKWAGPGKVEIYVNLNTEAPPIVLGDYSNIVDGNHRFEAAKFRGDEHIRVLRPLH